MTTGTAAEPVTRTRGHGATPDPGVTGRHAAGRHSVTRLLAALPWLLPTLVLIFGIVLYPAGLMVYNSTREISKSGVDKGSAGLSNYPMLAEHFDLVGALARTALWVTVVVLGTIGLSLFLANFLNKAFPGRTVIRLIVIVPWASSVLMTTMVVFYAFEPNYGLVNEALRLLSEHLPGLSAFAGGDFGFTRAMPWAFIIAIVIAVFVSLPFTTYTLLAGHQGISRDVLEAAAVDGARPRQTYFKVVLPQLRPALAASAIINIINVFNSFPILKVMTGHLPGFDADTTTTLMFKILQSNRRVDLASALSVINFGIVIVVIVIYMLVVKPLKSVED